MEAGLLPQALPLIAGYIVQGLVAASGAYAWFAALSGGIVAFGLSKLTAKYADQPGLEAPGVQANVKGTVQPIPIVYGTRRIGAALVQAITTGRVQTEVNIPPIPVGGGAGTYDVPDNSDNKFLNLVLVWCEGEVDGIKNLYFDDKLSTSSSLVDAFLAEHYVGTDTQLASTTFIDALKKTFNDETAARMWSANHRLLGTAYSYLKLTYDVNDWPTGIPTVLAEMRGRKVLDFRTGTTAWSDNPALIIYDYLTNTRFGFGIDSADLDLDTFIEAANYCEQVIFIETQAAVPPDVPQAGVSQARYACDAVLNPDDSLLDNLNILLSTCQGALVFAGGKYKLKLDKPEIVSFNLTEDNIVGNWTILLESTDTRFNSVKSQWINRSLRYQDDFAIVSSDEYLAADGGEVLEATPNLLATCNIYRARQINGMLLRQSRYSLQCEVTCTIAALGVEVFDVVDVTHSYPGWAGQKFRVMGVTITPEDEVRLQLRQYADVVYDLDSQNAEDSPPPTNLPDPRLVRAPLFLEATGLVERRIDGSYRTKLRAMWYVEGPVPVSLSAFELRWGPNVPGIASTSVRVPSDNSGTLSGLAPIPDPFVAYGYEFEADPDIEYHLEVRSVNQLGVTSQPVVYNVRFGDVSGSFGTPEPPTAVKTTGLPGGARIRWTLGANSSGVQVWVSKGNASFSAAKLLDATPANVFDAPAPSTTPGAAVYVYFWLRPFNSYGEFGSFSPSTSGAGYTQVNAPGAYADEASAIAAGLVSGDYWLDASNGNVLKVVT